MAEVEDRRGQILEAAFKEFAAKGFRGATIKSIAVMAGLQSPALIYWYFPDKEALFREALESYAPPLRSVADTASLMDLPPEEVLPRLGRSYLSIAGSTRTVQLVQLMLGEAVRRPEIAEMFVKAGPVRVLDFLKGYLERQVEAGRLRPHDVRSSARSYVGMLAPQIASRVLFPALAEDGLTDEEHLKTVTELFLRGLSPES